MQNLPVVWRKFPIDTRKPKKNVRTICEVLRELYRDAEARGDVLSMYRLNEVHDMAKRMQRKLQQYNPSEMILSEWKHDAATVLAMDRL